MLSEEQVKTMLEAATLIKNSKAGQEMCEWDKGYCDGFIFAIKRVLKGIDVTPQCRTLAEKLEAEGHKTKKETPKKKKKKTKHK